MVLQQPSLNPPIHQNPIQLWQIQQPILRQQLQEKTLLQHSTSDAEKTSCLIQVNNLPNDSNTILHQHDNNNNHPITSSFDFLKTDAFTETPSPSSQTSTEEVSSPTSYHSSDFYGPRQTPNTPIEVPTSVPHSLMSVLTVREPQLSHSFDVDHSDDSTTLMQSNMSPTDETLELEASVPIVNSSTRPHADVLDSIAFTSSIHPVSPMAFSFSSAAGAMSSRPMFSVVPECFDQIRVPFEFQYHFNANLRVAKVGTVAEGERGFETHNRLPCEDTSGLSICLSFCRIEKRHRYEDQQNIYVHTQVSVGIQGCNHGWSTMKI